MTRKIFVGGLSWNTTEDSLRQVFEQFGSIDEIKIITDRETGRSRGFGFVTFAESEAATTAISEMDGTELDGRTIKVNVAEERRPRGEGRYSGGDYSRDGGGRHKGKRNRW